MVRDVDGPFAKAIEEGLAKGVTQDDRVRQTRRWISRCVIESRQAIDRAKATVACDGTEEFWTTTTADGWQVPLSELERRRIEGDVNLSRCKDPLMTYLWLRQIEQPVPVGGYRDGAKRLEEFLRTADAKLVHPSIRLAMARQVSFLEMYKKDPTRQKSLAELAASAVTEELERCGQRMDGDRTWKSDAWWQREYVLSDVIEGLAFIEVNGGIPMRDKTVEAACAVKGLDPWLRHAILAAHHCELAWEARGSKSTDETPVERFDAAEGKVPDVLKHARAAFKEDPTHCGPATSVVLVARLAPELGEPVEWMMRGLRVAPDDDGLWNAMESSVRPRWVPKEYKTLLAEMAITALSQDPQRSAVPAKAYESLRILQADGYRLDKLIALLGKEKLVAALAAELERATVRGSLRTMQIMSANLVGLAFLTRDWELLQRHANVPGGLNPFTLRDHGLSQSGVGRLYDLLDNAGPSIASVRLGIDAELEQRWEQAATHWSDAIGSFQPRTSGLLRQAVDRHQTMARALAEYARGTPLSLAPAVLPTLFWAENCKLGLKPDGMFIEYVPSNALRLSFLQAFSTADFGENFEVSGTFILKCPEPTDDLACGVLVRAGASAPRGFSAFIWDPAKKEGRIGHSSALAKGVNRFAAPSLPDSKRMPFRVTVQGSDGEVFLDGQSLWRGRWPDGGPFSIHGQRIGVIGRTPGEGSVTFADFTVKPLPRR